ncbi:MAG: class I SAM-dependent methyltransferase [Syntrophomonadaceae bacterium]|jgi:tRNA A58 N-methylase Trm61
MIKIKGPFGNAVNISHAALVDQVFEGDVAVDATCGKGYDTLFLASLVGNTGKVIAFDIQQEALAFSRQLLQKHHLLERVTFVHDNHKNMAKYIDRAIKACMFNLGYLPGGNHDIKTRAADTVKAVDAAINLLIPGGIITIVFYPGHEGGQEEMEQVLNYLAGLSQRLLEINEIRFVNQVNKPPIAVLIKKLG